MEKYRIEKNISPLGNVRYIVEERFLYIFWLSIRFFYNEQETIDYMNKLNNYNND